MFVKDKKKFKREDFVFENGWFDKKVKSPGQLHMQQFNISDCQQCEIYIFDSSAAVYIDDCKYCTIFVGPSQSSLFIRDCHYLTVISMTQQFRLRDCTHSRFWIWCQSQPIIESSHHIILSCFPSSIGYEALLGQMKQAGLKLWNNNWFDIYDFTPTKFSLQNHKCVQTSPDEQIILSQFSNKIKDLNLKQKKQIIPYCLGTNFCQAEGINSYIVLVVFPILEESVGLPLLHSRTSKCPEELKSYMPQNFPNGLTLFIKIKNEEKDKWKRIPESRCKVVGWISDRKGKQILQNTVFVPFGDQR